jgi:hypothetical protein
VDAAVEIDTHHHCHVEHEPHRAGIQETAASRYRILEQHHGCEKRQIGNQHIDNAEYQSDELPISALALHEMVLMAG